MTDKRSSPRQQRRLPKVPTKGGNRDHLMNYRESELWLLRHQEILNKSLSILELYPRLIQHRSCERLRDFVSKVSVYSLDEDTPIFIRRFNGAVETNNKFGNLQIPVISVTDDESQHKKKHSAVQRVYICGQPGDTNWHRLVLGLCERFLIKYCMDETLGKDSNFNDHQGVIDADVFLFIIDDSTLCVPACLKLLKTALNQGLRVLFVRHEDYKLPRDLTTGLNGVTDQTNNNHSQSNNNTLVIPNNVDSQSDFTDDDTCSSDVPSWDTNVLRHIRSVSRSSPMAERPSPSPTNGGRDFCSTETVNENTATQLTSPVHSVHQQPIIVLSETTSTPSRPDEIDCVIREGFDKAYTYTKTNHEYCLKTLVVNIKQGRADDTIPPVDRKPTPTTDDFKNDSVAHTDDVLIALESNDTKVDRRSLKCRRDSVDTVFFVCRSELNHAKEPSIVHYPWVLDEMKVPPSPSLDSLGFQDIDLSKVINELDIFTPDEL